MAPVGAAAAHGPGHKRRLNKNANQFCQFAENFLKKTQEDCAVILKRYE